MNKILKRKNKKGFTLMEMLIVIGIIAILIAIAIPTFSSSQKKAKYTADLANVRSWYAEQISKKLSDDTYVLGTGEANLKAKLQFSSDATITLTPSSPVAATLPEDFAVTYDPNGDAKDEGGYKATTFPTPVTKSETTPETKTEAGS